MIKAYSPAVYNSLGDVEVQYKLVSHQEIYGLGKIIVKHGYDNEVVVIISHRHFDLEDNEVMYEVVEGDRRVASPRPLAEVVADKALPNILSCGLNGDWYPVAFEEPVDSFKAWEDIGFLTEVANYLVNNKLTDKLLIASRGSAEQKSKGVVFVEENFDDTRQSISRLSSQDGNNLTKTGAIPTTWGFKANSATCHLKEDMELEGVCIGHLQKHLEGVCVAHLQKHLEEAVLKGDMELEGVCVAHLQKHLEEAGNLSKSSPAMKLEGICVAHVQKHLEEVCVAHIEPSMKLEGVCNAGHNIKCCD